MNGRRLSVYTNTSHVQNVDAAAVPRMWALEDQLVTTQDILAEQLEARKQLERELATSKLEIERMRLELQQQQVQQQQQKEQEQEQAISTSGLDRADFPQAVDMDMPNDALEATDRFGDSPHTLISSQHKQTNSSDMSNSSHSRPTHRQSLQSIPSFTADPTDSPRRRSSSFFGTFVLPKTRSRSIQLPTPALHNLSNGQYPSSQSPSYSIQDTESEVTYDDISDELSVARQMNSKYRKELMSLHDALDISLQFVLSNAEKVMLQSDTELRSFYVLLPEASLPSPATPREPLKWQDFWPMEYVERLWDQDSEYDSDHDLPPQDYEVRGDNFAWWRFMTEFGAFQGMRTVRRKVSRGWELAQADAKLADAAEGEKVRLKMQQHRDLHFRHYHSRLGGGREIGDALCEEFVDLFELEEVQSDDGDITGVNRDGSDHATQGLLTSDGGAAHPRYPQHSGVLSTQGLSSDENSKKTRNINCDSEHDSDLALKDLPQTLSGRAQYSQLTDNPDHNNHSSPAFTESPRDSRTGRHLSVSGIAGSLLSSTTSWLMNPGKPTEKRFIQEDKDSGDWSVTPKLGWFDNEEKEQRPRSGDLLSLRPRESMLGLRWSSTDSSQKPSDKQENTLPLGETELGALPPNSTTTHDGLVGNANALPMSTNASVGRSWLTSIRTAMTTSTTTVSNSGSVPPVSNSHISEKLPLHVSNSTAKVSTTEDSVQFADSSPMNCIDSVHYQTTPPATPNHSSAHISATAAELKHQNLSRVPMIDSPPLGLRSQRRIILEEPE